MEDVRTRAMQLKQDMAAMWVQSGQVNPVCVRRKLPRLNKLLWGLAPGEYGRFTLKFVDAGEGAYPYCAVYIGDIQVVNNWNHQVTFKHWTLQFQIELTCVLQAHYDEQRVALKKQSEQAWLHMLIGEADYNRALVTAVEEGTAVPRI